MANDFVQTMIDARVDARSLSDFMFYPASAMVQRRLAPSIHTLNYYLDYLNGLESLYSQESGTVTVNGVEIKTVRQAMNDAVDDVLLGEYQEGMRADLNAQKLDTGITATAKFGGVERTQAEKNAEIISVKDFGAIGDGQADDSAAISLASASDVDGYVDGLGGVFKIDALPDNFAKFKNSTFLIGRIRYITQDAIKNAQTLRVANTGTYLAWTQDKCYTIGDQIVVWAMEAETHQAARKAPIRFQSGDGGSSWSLGEYLTDDKTQFGLTLWSAGFNPNNNMEYLVVRIGSSNKDIDPFTYELWSRYIDKSLPDYDNFHHIDAEWNKVPIAFTPPDGASDQPIMVHSMAFGPNNEIVVGAHYSSSKANAVLHRKLDGSSTWTTHVVGRGAEPTMQYDSGKWFGFLRNGSSNPLYFISTDNLTTFKTYTAPSNMFGSTDMISTPVPFTVVDGFIHAFASYRTESEAGGEDKLDIPAFYIKAPVVDDNVWSHVSITKLGGLRHADPRAASACGVGSVVRHRDKIHIFFGSEERYGSREGLQRKAGIYQTVIPLRSNGGLFDTRDRVIPSQNENPFRRINGILAAYTRDLQEKAFISARPNLGVSNVLIEGGVVDVSDRRAGFYFIDPKGTSPDLHQITDTKAIDGDVIVVSQVNSTNDITYKDNYNGGNLNLAGDFTPGNAQGRLMLIYYNGTWYELSRSTN